MKPITLEDVAKVVGGTLSGDPGAAPTGYSIDTRSLKPGDLFFAIVGPNHDGHDFVSDAAGKGASAVVVSAPASAPVGIASILVTDTLRALQDLAAHVRRSHTAKVVAITGSSGKTTTKEMTRAVLEAAFNVHSSRGNLNNLYGCPLSMLELRPEHQVSVLEMGMSFHGELARLAEIARPDIGILTNVSGAHLVNFTSLEDVADAKAELFAGLPENSIGIFNVDDDQCRRIMESFRGYAFTFGIERKADLNAAGYEMDGLDGSRFEVRHSSNGGERRVGVKLRFAGVHHVYNALAAMSAGYMLGIDLKAMADRLADLPPLDKRGRVLHLGESILVLDDSYNSNPAAMRQSLRVLKDAAPGLGTGRKVVVLGDMLELGKGEVEAHREIGRAIVSSGASLVVGVGPLCRHALEEIEGIERHHFGDSREAASFLAQNARPGDLILVKGSRGIALERVVDEMKERFGEE